MNSRGIILLQVLVAGIIVALIAAAVLRVTIGAGFLTERTNSVTIQKRADEGGFAQLMAVWNMNGPCTSIPGVYACSSPGTCNCTCTSPIAGNPRVVASGGGPPFQFQGQCVITATATDTVGLAASDNGAATY